MPFCFGPGAGLSFWQGDPIESPEAAIVNDATLDHARVVLLEQQAQREAQRERVRQ